MTQTTFLKKLLCTLLAVAVLAGTARAAWWNGEWSVRKKITLDTQGFPIADAVGSVPVLIRLHAGNFNFDNAKEDGSDLRFVASDDKTLLPYHIEKWDALMGEAFVWVRLAEVKPGAQVEFWLYCGNAGNSAPPVYNGKGTYDADTALVYHFNEEPAVDASPSGANAQNAGLSAEGSMIGTGLKLDGKIAVTVPAVPALVWSEGGAMTWSAWFKSAAAQPNAILFSPREGGREFVVGVDQGVPYVEVGGGSSLKRSPAGTPVAVNTWHHLAVVAQGAKIALYLDGEPYGGGLDAALPALNTPAAMGGSIPEGETTARADENSFQGELDELQISKVARSSSFLKLQAASQGADKAAMLIKCGEDEQTSSLLSGGYFGVIIKNLSADGWVVIGLLAVMACISWYVMVTKIAYLNAVSAGNALFTKAWNQIATDLTGLDAPDADASHNIAAGLGKADQRAVLHAPLYRIYHSGVEEIRHRIAAEKCGEERGGLSGRSIQAIRATLDGKLVRETQRINSKIVLLTICISGGPFLGLLGTVVGVMITFAAVAAAGEVNVSAIAPGIAAALLATVAGLAVAIPSLFGYNYILTRIKETTSDMHVFIDEFVTRMAEFYLE
jgi:biopolymer transport protein ExbB